MTKPFALLTALALAGIAGCRPGAGETSAPKPVETAPAPETVKAAPTPEVAKIYLPTEIDALRPLLGEKVIIEGRLVRQGANKGQSIRYLNFTQNYRDSTALVFFTEKGGESFAKANLTEWLGKKVRASGTLADFNGNLQIEIETWDQVQEITEPTPAAEPAGTP